MILNDKQIKKLAEEEGMITPFLDKSVSMVLARDFSRSVMIFRPVQNLKFLQTSKET